MIRSRAAILKSIGDWHYDEISIPNLNSEEAIIKIISSGICSTDIVRSMETGFYSYPIVPGHEMLGYIYKLGKKIPNLKEGDKVCVYPLINKCEDDQCCGHVHGSHGFGKYPNLCSTYDFLGSRSNGGYSEYVLSPIKNLVRVPTNLDDDLSIFTEPASVALHALNIAKQDRTFDSVLILGLGPIGISIAAWCKFNKIENVIGVDRNLHRFDNFKKIGYSNIIDTNKKNISENITKYADKNGVEIVFECSGSEELLNNGIQNLKKSGKIIILSNQLKNVQLNTKSMNKILREEIVIKGSWSSILEPFNEWELTLETLKKGQLNIKHLISHKFKFSDAPKLFKSLHKKELKYSKVLLTL